MLKTALTGKFILSQGIGHLSKARAAPQKLFVGTFCNHPTLIQFNDSITTPNGTYSVRYDQDSEVTIKPLDCLHHRLFSCIVEGASSLVKHKNTSLNIKGPRYTNTLTLTA